MENLGLKPRPFYGGEDVKEELKAIYNDRVVYGLTDNSNVYIDAVSLKEVLDCSIYSELMKSNRLWVSADDLAVILEDNNCPTNDFEKWLISIRNMDFETYTLTYINDKKVYYRYEGQEPVFSLNSIVATHYNTSSSWARDSSIVQIFLP